MRFVESVCVLTLVAIGTSGCSKAEADGLPPAQGPGAPPRPELPTIASSGPQASHKVSSGLVVTGSTYPIEEAKVGPKGQGIIAALPVDEGDVVKKGQLLFRLDGAMQAHSVAQARAALATAEVAQTTAQTDFQRTAGLKERGAVSQAVFDQMKARLDGAEMGVRQAKAALSTAQQMAADTAVYSPIDGIVAERKTNVGEAAPPVVMTIENISTLEVRARLPERALTRVKEGTQAKARFQTGVERTIEVARLSPSIDTKTRTFEIVALLPNEDHALKAGMLVELDFGVDAQPASPAASAVPSAASGGTR